MKIETVLCDLDGVVWLAHVPIPGSVDAIARFRAAGRRVVFVTNNSAARVADHEAALDAIGIPAIGDVVSSSMAAAHLIEAGERVLVTGGSGIVEAAEARGAVVVHNDGVAGGVADVRGGVQPFDVVMVGLDRDFDYGRLAVATSALRGGARLIGTNTDSTYPTPHGLDPGGGSILAAVAAAGGVTPEIGGKPHQPMADLIAAVVTEPGAAFDPGSVLMVGDRPETDGLMAARVGCPFALVRSGVTQPTDDVSDQGELEVTFDVADLGALVDVLLGGTR